MTTLTVAAPQWLIGVDRGAAGRTALLAGADALHLDYGGAHRGRPLSEPAELREAEAIARDIPVPVLAVNHVNDLGLALDHGRSNPAAVAVLDRALECALRLGARVLHVPGFRRSLPMTPARRSGTVEALRAVCARAPAGMTVAYESPLGSAQAIDVARAVGAPALRLVLDTGNLINAGQEPLEFAMTVTAAGLLLPDLHIKDPDPGTGAATLTGPVHDGLPELLRWSAARSVLVENDYHAGNDAARDRRAPTGHRHAVRRLRADILLCRAAVATLPTEDVT